eukprot:1916643-Heterocapsa_arctica.AAC.1
MVATKTVEGEWLIQASQVVGEATNRWSELWTGSHSRDVMCYHEFVGSLSALKPLQPQELWDIVRRIGTGKAVGMDAWGPWEAIVELTAVLNQIEGDSAWPESLRGALVALLPKKDD